MHPPRINSSVLLAEVSARGVLSRVDLLVVKVLDESVETSSDRGSEERTNPVDPVVGGEGVRHNGGTKASGWVERTSSVKDACGVSVVDNVGSTLRRRESYHPS
jgi:hypothetical protein